MVKWQIEDATSFWNGESFWPIPNRLPESISLGRRQKVRSTMWKMRWLDFRLWIQMV